MVTNGRNQWEAQVLFLFIYLFSLSFFLSIFPSLRSQVSNSISADSGGPAGFYTHVIYWLLHEDSFNSSLELGIPSSVVWLLWCLSINSCSNKTSSSRALLNWLCIQKLQCIVCCSLRWQSFWVFVCFFELIIPKLLGLWSLPPELSCPSSHRKQQVQVFWVVTPCRDVTGYQHFGGPWYLHLQAAWSSDTLVSWTQKNSMWIFTAVKTSNPAKGKNGSLE